MLHTGLCSVTFRKHATDELIDLARKGGIEGIEWGGDVHVPPGDLENARVVGEKTAAAGLSVCSYGSYYRCDEESGSPAEVLETADALGAPIIRVWAGRQDSETATTEYRAEVVECLRRIVIAAQEFDITIALEYHGKTFTDTQESAHKLLEEVGLPGLRLFWQPRTGGVFENDLVELEAALPHLAHVHCFNWGPEGRKDARPLLDGAAQWHQFLDIVCKIEGDRFVILEFVKDDAPEQFIEDAKVLRSLINGPAKS
ncbi:MAG: TIM barrel protein [Verrucomicrobia bacterium]|jgi:sugar phosphate isomerase/epimerase|nr:TIM barrel protein [Verrucomicrobiota bacterium]